MSISFRTSPRITPERFAAVLVDAGSPLAPEADAAYQACVDAGLDSACILGMAKAESQYGTDFDVNVPSNRNLLNVKNRDGYKRGRNGFARFATWLAGWIAAVDRIAYHPLYADAQTVRELITVYAPREENDLENYIAVVERLVEEWSGGAMQIVDIRHLLPTAPQTEDDRSLTDINLLVVHWNGTPADLSKSDLELWEQDALYHIAKDWGGGHYGGGIMYHYGVGRDGVAYYLRNETIATWHAYALNTRGLAVNCPLGTGQTPTAAQLQGVEDLADYLLTQRPDLPNLARRDQVLGHGEGTIYGGAATQCPGPELLAALADYRLSGPEEPSDVLFFPETGHGIGGGFLAFWELHGGTEIFGLPLTDEFTEGGMTVQYFERARFEYHPNEAETVQLGLIGAELLEARRT